MLKKLVDFCTRGCVSMYAYFRGLVLFRRVDVDGHVGLRFSALVSLGLGMLFEWSCYFLLFELRFWRLVGSQIIGG